MGLTIHYRLQLPGRVSLTGAHALVTTAHRHAAQLVTRRRLRGLSDLMPATESPMAVRYTRVGPKRDGRWTAVEPLEGWLFTVDVGEGCEPATFGLCRYPPTVPTAAGPARTRCGTGWHLATFSKTQYASLHGWKHFLVCHRAVIDLALLWSPLGVTVEITDEGSYWPGRSVRSLRTQIDQMNGIVAGLAGALKDVSDDADLAPVQSPVFAHPHFERLEAEGVARHGDLMEKVARALRPSP